MARILCLGRTKLDFNRTIRIDRLMLNKPFGTCIWGSTLIKHPDGSKSSYWKQYTSCNYEEKDFDYGISFTLNRKSKILEIASVGDYISAMEKYKIKILEHLPYQLDFNKISKDYDVFHITNDAFHDMRFPFFHNKIEEIKRKYNYDDFYSYDSESWIIFNMDAINKGSILNHNNIVGY